MPNISWMLRKYIDDLFDPTTGHAHDGSDSARVYMGDCHTGGEPANIVYEADGSGGVQKVTNTDWNDLKSYIGIRETSFQVGSTSIGFSYTDILTVTPTFALDGYYVTILCEGVIALSRDVSGTLTNSMKIWSRILQDTTQIDALAPAVQVKLTEASENISNLDFYVPIKHELRTSGITGTPAFKWQLSNPTSGVTASVINARMEVRLHGH